MGIQLLDERVIAKIAAGEVIERPASVVKELVENALDAGATDIFIAAQGGGRRLIRVSDNGCGIPADEVELAIARHATSKLRDVDDLERMQTLGFRGEALASIAAVSHLTMMTRSDHQDVGTQLRIEGGEVISHRAVGAPQGTILTVENLFFNTPARLKFLKADNTERRHITSIVMNYALAYPDVRFTLEQDGRETLHTDGTGYLSDALVKLFGVDDFKRMVEVRDDPNSMRGRIPVEVYGYSSEPDFSRGDRTKILLFVNGRAIQDSKLAYAVIQAYHTFLMNGRYPIAVLMITLPPDEVDVNVHPTKAEVRFRDPSALFTAVQRAVRKAVVSQASPLAGVRGNAFQTTERTAPDIQTNLGAVDMNRQMDMNSYITDTGQHARGGVLGVRPANGDDPFERDYDPDDPTAIPEGIGQPKKPRTLPLLRVVGQVAAAYIIAEGPSGMYLVDQHAAHERILYEQFMAAYHSEEPQVQQTLNATVQLSPIDAKLVEENMPALEKVGFSLEPFGPNMFTVRTVPAMLADANPQAVVASIVSDLEHGNTPGEIAIEEKIVRRICKQVAVKAGQVLGTDEMQGIIRQLERCESPHTCPHGRPTILHMSADQLAKEFGRAGKR
ncbi:MAG: DNA mismatch repair endonuclease MutL [Chloroflexota bacterium]